MSRRYWPALDGLRSVAVLIVLAAHAGVPYPRSGGVGVDLFFVLSGFLITGILSGEASATGRISLRDFYARRFLRLAPALVMVCAGVLFAAVIVGDPLPLGQVGVALTYTANWARALFDYDLGALDHCWSLAIEEQYYLVWPLVVWGLERSVKGDFRKGWILVGFALLTAVYRFAMVGTYSAERIYFGLDTHLDGLVLGSALSYFVRAARGDRGRLERFAGVLSYGLVPMAIAGLLAIMHLLTWEYPWMGRLGFFLVAGAGMVLVADLVWSPLSWLAPMLSVAPAVYLGRISYGLYLYHFPIYRGVERGLPDAPFPVALGVKLALTLLVAALSFHLFEVRFLRLKRRFERSEGQATAETSATAARANPASSLES